MDTAKNSEIITMTIIINTDPDSTKILFAHKYHSTYDVRSKTNISVMFPFNKDPVLMMLLLLLLLLLMLMMMMMTHVICPHHRAPSGDPH